MMKPVLSICIPIYNRSVFLRKILERFLLDKELFDNKIHLFISDNCSEEDLGAVCNEFAQKGLKLEYTRNATNLNMDGNFESCFLHSKGKYTYLLGSDDIPKKDFLIKILNLLEEKEFGLLNLQSSKSRTDLIEYDSSETFLEVINVWITYLSGNIVNSSVIKDVNLPKYKGTFFTQVPVYLQGALSYNHNMVLYGDFFEDENESKKNGGYNLFEVFIHQFLSIVHEQVEKGKLSKKSYAVIKRKELSFVMGFIYRLLIRKEKTNWHSDNGWKILWKYYGYEWYFYYYLLKAGAKKVLGKYK